MQIAWMYLQMTNQVGILHELIYNGHRIFILLPILTCLSKSSVRPKSTYLIVNVIF